jgi:hypothetical protein
MIKFIILFQFLISIYLINLLFCSKILINNKKLENKKIINPIADPKAIILFKNSRFIVLTPELIRMEYSPTLIFNDFPTFSIINRNLPVPIYNTSSSSNCLKIETSNLKLQYCENNRPFNDDNLKVEFLTSKITKYFNETKNPEKIDKEENEDFWSVWVPSLPEKGNLLGTIRTLDGCEDGCELNCNKYTEKQKISTHCEFGLISK